MYLGHERIKLLHEPLPTPEQQPVDEPDPSISDDDKLEPPGVDLTDTNMGQLNPRLRAELLKMLEVFRACNGPHMELSLVDENSPPFQAKQRRYSPEEVTMIQAEIQKMVAAGIIQRSTSPWAAGLVLVRQKDGTVRMCQDYRKLNERLVEQWWVGCHYDYPFADGQLWMYHLNRPSFRLQPNYHRTA